MASSEEDKRERANQLATLVIGAAIEVHRHLGPGLLESVYHACMREEMVLRGIPFETERPVALNYKGRLLEHTLRLDLVVGGLVIVELKAIEKLDRVHDAQLLSYLRLSDLWLGLLINFNVPVLRNGIKRLACG
jgi:GxxExxY protein